MPHKWPRGGRVFQHPARIEPLSPDSLRLTRLAMLASFYTAPSCTWWPTRGRRGRYAARRTSLLDLTSLSPSPPTAPAGCFSRWDRPSERSTDSATRDELPIRTLRYRTARPVPPVVTVRERCGGGAVPEVCGLVVVFSSPVLTLRDSIPPAGPDGRNPCHDLLSSTVRVIMSMSVSANFPIFN